MVQKIAHTCSMFLKDIIKMLDNEQYMAAGDTWSQSQ